MVNKRMALIIEKSYCLLIIVDCIYKIVFRNCFVKQIFRMSRTYIKLTSACNQFKIEHLPNETVFIWDIDLPMKTVVAIGLHELKFTRPSDRMEIDGPKRSVTIACNLLERTMSNPCKEIAHHIIGNDDDHFQYVSHLDSYKTTLDCASSIRLTLANIQITQVERLSAVLLLEHRN